MVESGQFPTHQYAKFNTEVMSLHGDINDLESCWGQFRQLMTKRREIPDSEYMARETIPTHQYVKDGLDARVIYLTSDDFEGFREWFYCGRTGEQRRQRVA